MTTDQLIVRTLFLLLSMAALPLYAQNAHRELLWGDRAFRQKDYPEAEQNYRRAELKLPGLQSWYNLGNTLYSQERYEEASAYFQKAAEAASTPALRARALHNLGNAQFQQENYTGAVEAYKQALRLQPEGSDTRYNLALAMQEQQAQNAEENAENEQKKVEEQSNRNEGKDDAGTGEAKDKPAVEGSEKRQAPGGNGQPKTDKRQTSGAGEQEPSDDRQATTPMNKSEAEKLLQTMEREEQKVQQRLRRATSTPPKSSKDW